VATLNVMFSEGVIKHCAEMGSYIYYKLMDLKKKFSFITDVRGKGLIIGIELSINGDEVLKEFMKEGIILNCTKGKILRLLPPLVIQKEEADIFLELASRIFERWENR
jgi:acetylornithine/N-succinyldiaminopimelate aminotransferase